MRRRFAWLLGSISCVGFCVACGGSGSSQPSNDAADTGPSVDPQDFVLSLPASCAFDCKNGCPDESVGPFVCPAMKPWNEIPHDVACGNGEPTPPAPTTGQCTATEPTGEAIVKAGFHDPYWVLPDGHRLAPSGKEAILADGTHVGGFPVSLAPIASTHYAIVVEAGFGDHLVRTIDLDAVASGDVSKAIVTTVAVPLANWGLVVRNGDTAGKHRAFVSGGDSGKVWVFDVDDTSGALTQDEGKTIDLGTITGTDGKPAPFFSAGIAVTPDGKTLAATSVLSRDLRILSLDAATYGKELSRVDLGGSDHYTVAMDPNDTTGEVAYVSMWANAQVAAIDLASGSIKKTIPVGKDPEQMAFLDARWMVVAAADGDVLTIVDRVAGSAIASIPISPDPSGKRALHGWSPTALTYDATAKRLYVAESITNVVEAFDVDLSGAAPTLTSRFRLPTSWWPTDVALDPSGRLVVLTGRGHGTGSGTGTHFGPGDGEIAQVMHGSVEVVDVASVDTAAATKLADTLLDLKDVAGYPTVQCPAGADDFPVPTTNDHRSAQIQHVVLVIRENKNFDGVLGDMPNVDGKAEDVLVPGKMDDLWTNFRAIGRTWTILDDYYTDAEYSSQGHVWATYGRTTDFTEKSWLNAAANKGRVLSGGVTDVGRAEEGSIFEWLLAQHVDYDILGEGTGLPSPPKDARNPLDSNYPGIVQQIGLEDVTKSCYFAGRARALCDLHDFVYVTLPNDHTFGGGGNHPTPETMIAVNDEATGVLLDALSHSPFWPSTLVIVTEDDPQDGADHVDLHRTPIVFAGPWVKKGYVAHGHYDVASIMKLIFNVRGIPYPNEVIARAPLPLEMFTSTPDYAPYTFSPRKWPLTCNVANTKFAVEAAQWTDWDDVDEQLGLGVHVREMLKATPEERGWVKAP